MKKIICCFFGAVMVFTVFSGIAQAELNININLGEPSHMVMIPRTNIYYVPDVSFDIFFYNGFWWSKRGDRWYKASHYKGSWGVVKRSYVPSHLSKIPKNYRVVYKKEKIINYGQWKKDRWKKDQWKKNQQKKNQQKKNQWKKSH